jgi:plastocyanin
MAKKEPFIFGATFIAAMMLVLFFVYLTMIYPSERNKLLGEGEDSSGISIEGMRFVPDTIEINAGGKVTWRNRDAVKHTVAFAEFNSGVLNPGDTYTHTFDEPGTYVYSCEFHTSMSGTVIVK